MEIIDIRTLYLNYVVVNIVSLFMVTVLWRQSRNRFEGTHFFVLDFALQITCLLLIFLRGRIPDFFSMALSIPLSLTGTFMGLIGLSKFTGKQVNYTINIVFIVALFLLQTWFSVVDENLHARNLNFSFFFLLLSLQSAWIMLVDVPAHLKKLTRLTGIVYLLFSTINSVRIIVYFLNDIETNDYLNSGPFESGVILLYQILFTFLTFSLILMVNGRLSKQIITEEEKFSKAFQLAPYAVLLTRLSDGKIYEMNEGFFKLSGYQKEEASGKTTQELLLYHNPDDREKLVKMLSENGKVKDLEFTFRKKSGELLFGLLSAELLAIDNEISVLTTIYDLTPRKILENKLVETNATKDKFFSIIAHDLRNPLSTIIGFSNLLKESQWAVNNNEIVQYAGAIQKAATGTLQLLENLLDWSLIQQGRIFFEPKKIGLKSIADEVIENLSGSATNKKILVHNLIPNNLEVTADENMIKAIFRNLIGNAIKFTLTGGSVEIKAALNNLYVEVAVSDNGIGISKENIDKLFKIESGYSTRGTANEKGTGLGLILSHEFVEKHGGKIWIESAEGKGSTFCFSIPVVR